MVLEGGSWTGVFLGGNAAGAGGKGRRGGGKRRRRKIQSRDAVWNPNGHFPAYRAESVGQRRGWASQDPIVLYSKDPSSIDKPGG